MQRFLSHSLNVVLLALVFFGLPAITGMQLWHWRISSEPQARLLMLWGLGLAGAVNLAAALILAKGRKSRVLCLEWAAVFAALVLVEYAYNRGYINFDWLKQALSWLQERF